MVPEPNELSEHSSSDKDSEMDINDIKLETSNVKCMLFLPFRI